MEPAAEEEAVPNPDLISSKSNVLLKLPSGNYKSVQISKEPTTSIGKFGTFRTQELIGKYFGIPLEIYDRDKLRFVCSFF
jgi:tRNA (adenine-N(1)-)-methyltransferase non-catalytic subunit